MEKYMIKFSISTIFLLCFLSTTNATTMTFPNDSFSISLPDTWVQIPGNVILNKIAELKQRAPNSKPLQCDYAFQLAGTPWFTYPYIVITTKKTGRMSEEETEEMKKVNLDSTINATVRNSENLISNVSIGQSIYDPRHNIVWSTGEMDVSGGPISMASALVLTERGFIQILSYCKKADLPLYGGVFQTIIESVLLPDGYRYKNRVGHSTNIGGISSQLLGINWNKGLFRFIFGIIILAVLVGGFVLFLKRRKSK